MNIKLAIHGGTPARSRPVPAWPIFDQSDEQSLLAVLRSGKWGRIDGDEVARFERRFADYHQSNHGIAVVNGTVSLRLALLAAGITAGDEVIVPAYTFMATAAAVVETNATPVFVDVELTTMNIDPHAAQAAVTPRTRAIIPVHLGGQPAALDALMDLAKKHNLIVIEDAAQAHGAEFQQRKVGGIGHLGSFSFQSTKNVCCGEGGLITTNDAELGARCRSLHNCGRVPGGKWYEHHFISGNYRLSEFQAAVLHTQFDRFEEQAKRREDNGRYLAERLAQIPGILPQQTGGDCTRHAYHLLLFRVESRILGVGREVFLEALEAEGIPVTPGYLIPLYRQRMFLDRQTGPFTGCRLTQEDLQAALERCPNTEKLCQDQGAWIPQHVLLGTREDMDEIVWAFEKAYEGRASLRKSV